MPTISIDQLSVPSTPDMQSVFQYGKLAPSGRYPRHNICTPDPVFWRFRHKIIKCSLKLRTTMSVLLLFDQFAPRSCNVVSKSNALRESEIEIASHRSSPTKQFSQSHSATIQDYRQVHWGNWVFAFHLIRVTRLNRE